MTRGCRIADRVPAALGARAERWAGLAVVLAILVSACVAGYEAIVRLIDPRDPTHLVALGASGVVGFAGNWVAALIRTRAGQRLDSAALIADGAHARSDAYVSLGVVASAIVVGLGFPILGLAITLMILHITWESWQTVRGADPHEHALDGHHDHPADHASPAPRDRWARPS